MKWVEYKLENGSVIKVPYNRYDVAPVSKKVLEELINDVNASISQIEQIRADVIEEAIEKYKTFNCKICKRKDEERCTFGECTIAFLEMLKEQK